MKNNLPIMRGHDLIQDQKFYSDPGNKKTLLHKSFLKKQFLSKEIAKINHGPFGFEEDNYNALEKGIEEIRMFERLLNDESMTGQDAEFRLMSLNNISVGLDYFPIKKDIPANLEDETKSSGYYTDPANKKILLQKSFLKKQLLSKQLSISEKESFGTTNDRSIFLEKEIEDIRTFEGLLNNESMTGQDAFFREMSLNSINKHLDSIPL